MSALAAASRRLRLHPRWLPLSRRRLRLVVAASAISGFLVLGGWLLLRDSSVVSVEHVTISGVAGPDAMAIRAALDSAARKMTTLDVQTALLRRAVSRFPEVKGLRVSTRFPHGLVIHVVELGPVAAVKDFGREVAVAADGMLLRSVPVTGSLPLIALAEPPIGARLPEPWARSAATLLGAAPRRLLPRLAEVMTVAGHGLVVQVRSGPSIYFGDATQPQAKWMAVLAVLADPGSAGAEYIDVTDPARPAAGAGPGVAGSTASSSAAAAAGTAQSATATTTTTPTALGTVAATTPTTSGTVASTAATASGTVASTTSTTSGTVASTTTPTGG